MAVAETTRSYTISLPAKMGELAEEMAAREGHSMSDLVAEALLVLDRKQGWEMILRFSEESMRRNPGYTEEDIPRLIREVRDEEQERNRARDSE